MFSKYIVHQGIDSHWSMTRECRTNFLRTCRCGAICRISESEVFLAYLHKDIEAVKRHFIALDVLLMDDIEFLDGDPRSQEVLLHVFNVLIDNQKQIVVTSICPLGNFTNMNSQLINILESGNVVMVEQPDLELTMAILYAKAAEHNVNLSSDVALLIAQIGFKDIRELKGGLNRALAYCKFHNVPITHEHVRVALKEAILESAIEKCKFGPCPFKS